MKSKILIGMVFVWVTLSGVVSADVFVNGYTRSDGTYVQPHYRSNPDGNIYNNWSTKGNYNPYTGKLGTRNSYSGYNPSYNPTYNPPNNSSLYRNW